MITAIWFLIVSFSGDGGVAVIPQQSREACLVTAQWVHENRYAGSGNLMHAACVQGVKQ